jgi:hypothetical protein
LREPLALAGLLAWLACWTLPALARVRARPAPEPSRRRARAAGVR